MKYNKFNIPIILIFLFLPFAGKPQIFEKQKNISRSFAVSKDCSIQVSNKYGDIHIVPWDKDSACFSIDIKAADKGEADADKMLNAIDIDFTGYSYYIVAKTVISDNKSQVLSGLSDMANSLFNTGKKVEIKYFIYVPQTASLKVENKYGNIYTTNHSGNVQFILSNGDLKANDLTGNDTKIDLSFGNGVVNTIKNGKLTVGYSDFDIKNAENLAIESKSAKVNISKVKHLDISSKRDKYNIDTVGTLNGQTNFSYINAYFLKESFFLNALYGNINLSEITSDFKFVNINSDCTDINLCFQKTSSANISMLCKKTQLSYPPVITGLQKRVLNEKSNEFAVSGTIGLEIQPGSAVQINAVSGSIILNTK